LEIKKTIESKGRREKTWKRRLVILYLLFLKHKDMKKLFEIKDRSLYIKNEFVYWVVVTTIVLLCNPITIIGLFLYGAAGGM
tara:strand:- start:155 stop:400 length:246 start_codon:yes stop_codon:yes gene_type:complete